MGSIPSATFVGDKATFGFVYASAPDNPFTGSFSGSYHDPQGETAFGVVDVALKGTGVLRPCNAANPDPLCAKAPPVSTKGGCLEGLALTYTSQNPAIPGDGTLDLVLCDSDGTFTDLIPDDFMIIRVDTGPYMNYTNAGTPSGNITVSS